MRSTLRLLALLFLFPALAAAQSFAGGGAGIFTDGTGTMTIGGPTNNVQIDASGNMVFNGTATYFIDYVLPPTAIKVGGTNPPGFAAWLTSLGIYWFDASQEEDAFISLQMPHCAEAGANIMPHVHWTPKTTADGTPASQKVEWCLDYSFAEIGAVMPAAQTVCGKTHTPADANVVANTHYLTPLTAITPGTGADGVSAVLIGHFYRNADDATDDTYEDDAGLLSVDFHIECAYLGSFSEFAY